MAGEDTHEMEERPRTYSTDKDNIEKVEQLSDVSPRPDIPNSAQDTVSITWKTWAVIFVRSLSLSSSLHLT